MIEPRTPDGWTSVKSSFYNELLAAHSELLAAARHAHTYLVQSNDPDKRELADELWAAMHGLPTEPECLARSQS
jgi:hypothetical protein